MKIYLDSPYRANSGARLIFSFAMQRSGQHLIIEWLSRGLGSVLHLNHCRFYLKFFKRTLTPMTGRRLIYNNGELVDDSGIQGRKNYIKSLSRLPHCPKTLLYSMEDVDVESSSYQKLVQDYKSKKVFIFRDPANWLASSLAHGRHSNWKLSSNVAIYKKNIKFAMSSKDALIINYNYFISSKDYREEIASHFKEFNFINAEKSMENTPDFGGGSSFGESKGNTLERWKKYKDNEFFQRTMNDDELSKISREIFGIEPSFDS